MSFKKIFSALILSSVVASSVVHAEAPPVKSRDFEANYKEVMSERPKSPQVAECIATGHDLVAKNASFDRLGITKEDVGKAEIKPDHIKVPGEVRDRASGSWQKMTLGCDFAKGKLTNIEIQKQK